MIELLEKNRGFIQTLNHISSKILRMFFTKDDLKLAYGVDLDIAEAYVNRPVPAENLYWKNRSIYIPPAPGYFFMPIYSDILLRCGAEKEFILSDVFFNLNESILHSAALLEHNEIDWSTHISQSIHHANPWVTRPILFSEINEYLSQPILRKQGNSLLGTRFPSLNRADSYLLSIASIPSEYFDEAKAIQAWYALMTYFLIQDDLADIKDDLRENEENVLIDAGMDDAGFQLITEMIDQSHDALLSINPILSNRIDYKRKMMDLKEILRSIIS